MFGVTSINVEEFSSSEEEEDEGDDGAEHSGSEESGSEHGADNVSGGGNDGQVHVMEVSTAATPRKPRPKPVRREPAVLHAVSRVSPSPAVGFLLGCC